MIFRCLSCVLTCLCRRKPQPEAAAEPLVPKQVVVVPAQPPPVDPSKAVALANLNAALSRGEISAAQFAQAVAALG